MSWKCYIIFCRMKENHLLTALLCNNNNNWFKPLSTEFVITSIVNLSLQIFKLLFLVHITFAVGFWGKRKLWFEFYRRLKNMIFFINLFNDKIYVSINNFTLFTSFIVCNCRGLSPQLIVESEHSDLVLRSGWPDVICWRLWRMLRSGLVWRWVLAGPGPRSVAVLDPVLVVVHPPRGCGGPSPSARSSSHG